MPYSPMYLNMLRNLVTFIALSLIFQSAEAKSKISFETEI